MAKILVLLVLDSKQMRVAIVAVLYKYSDGGLFSLGIGITACGVS